MLNRKCHHEHWHTLQMHLHVSRTSVDSEQRYLRQGLCTVSAAEQKFLAPPNS